MSNNTYRDGIDRIKAALKQPAWHKGRTFLRFDHGLITYRGKKRYAISYQWCSPGAHYTNGIVYNANLGIGDDFESALADAIRKQAKAEGAE